MKKILFVMSMTVLAMAGCKSKSEGGAGESAAAAASPECKEAGEHVQELMLQKTKADAPDSEKSAAFGKSRTAADKVAAACTKDKWGPDAINCVRTTDNFAGCDLTPDQKKVLPQMVKIREQPAPGSTAGARSVGQRDVDALLVDDEVDRV
ncbi:MAG: hypothetical protein WKG01_13330 [Kofleriaceae bacterium]